MKMRSVRCKLDSDGCIDLLAVLKVMNQIDQEQAWAIAYELARLMQRRGATNCAQIDNLAQVKLHSDGYVHEKSVQIGTTNGQQQEPAATIEKCHTAKQQQSRNNIKQQVSIKRSSQDIEMEEKVVCEELDQTTISTATTTTTTTTTNTTTHLPETQITSPNRLRATDSDQSLNSIDEDSTKTTLATLNTNETTTKNNNNNNNSTTTTSKVPPTPPITPEMMDNSSPDESPVAVPINGRRPASDETKLVASLGIALFWALDYGIPDDEERKLSFSLECLIYQSQTKLSLNELIEICTRRLSVVTEAQADLHYRNICKSLVYDTIELSLFLDKIYTATMVLSDIKNQQKASSTNNYDATGDHIIVVDDDIIELGEPLASLRALRINDWARLWMQVIRELRQRGKFKQQAIAAVG